MSGEVVPITFACGDDTLIGLIHAPGPAASQLGDTGVVVVVGGPQYRVGSHRQFLHLARGLAASGVAVLRFDYRGMGDSDGAYCGFEYADEDIRAAVDALIRHRPEVRRVVLWGLCDAASAILAYAGGDPRVAAIAIANPWVRTAAGLARARLRHYYGEKLRDPAFWRKIARGEWRVAPSLISLGRNIVGALGLGGEPPTPPPQAAAQPAAPSGQIMPQDPPPGAAPLPARMALGLVRFAGPVLLILSGQDITAREFEDASATPGWRGLLDQPRVTRRALDESDHTFSRDDWRAQVTRWTAAWIASIPR